MACKVCDNVVSIYRYKVASEFKDGNLADMVVDEAAKYCPECGRRIYKETEPEAKPELKYPCSISYCGLNIGGQCVEGHRMGLYCNRMCKSPTPMAVIPKDHLKN